MLKKDASRACEVLAWYLSGILLDVYIFSFAVFSSIKISRWSCLCKIYLMARIVCNSCLDIRGILDEKTRYIDILLRSNEMVHFARVYSCKPARNFEIPINKGHAVACMSYEKGIVSNKVDSCAAKV